MLSEERGKEITRVPINDYLDFMIDELANEIPYLREQFRILLEENMVFKEIEVVDPEVLESLSEATW